MAKLKSRAARKQQRVKAARAEAHGLPQPELPQLVKRAPRDPVLRDEIARRSPAAAGRRAERVAAANQNGGLPTIYKVLIGAAAAVGLVFGLSQLRKADQIDAQVQGEEPDPSSELSSPGMSQSVPTDAPVPVVDAAVHGAENDPAVDPQSDSTSLAVEVSPETPSPERQSPEGQSNDRAASPSSVPSAGARTSADLSGDVDPKTVAPSQPKTVAPVSPQVVAPTEPKVVAPAAPKIVAPAEPKVVAPTEPTPPQAETPKTPGTP